MSTRQDQQDQQVSGWATGGLVFASVMLALAGFFQIIAGIAAISNDEFFVQTRNYTYDIDITAWGWIHLFIGLGCIVVSFGLWNRAGWAAVFGMLIAGLSAISNFFFIPHYPIWSLLVIGIDLWVIWALSRPGVASDW